MCLGVFRRIIIGFKENFLHFIVLFFSWSTFERFLTVVTEPRIRQLLNADFGMDIWIEI
jgi:hypothetical protein